MISSNDFKTKTTLLRKLLKFFLPLLIIPIVAIIIFYQYYIHSLITQEFINNTQSTITRISNSSDIQKYFKNNKDITLSDILIIDLNGKIVTTNKLYTNKDAIDKYIKSAILIQNHNLYHNKIYKFMIKPILKADKIVSFVVINYKNNLNKKLINVKHTFLFIMLIVILIIFISIIITFIFALQLTNPIKELINGIKIISEGDRTHRINIQTDDEISILANSFNMLIDDINQNQEEIQNFNKTLQDKIQQEVQKNREKDKAMLQQSRLAQMGEMISMIAHQWRQPLTAISATSSNLTLKAKLDMLDNDTAVELGEKISQYSQHLSSTIDDFRDFFKPNKQIVDTTYKELVQSVLTIIENSIYTKNIELKQNLKSEVVFSSYPNELKQVILNLIKNAEDVLLEKEIEHPIITIETEDNILRVRDNAGGVPEDIIEKVFDPYFSTKTQKDGTGLGLYMSKTIVEEHCGGMLSVSNDDFGAIFEMKLPLKKA